LAFARPAGVPKAPGSGIVHHSPAPENLEIIPHKAPAEETFSRLAGTAKWVRGAGAVIWLPVAARPSRSSIPHTCFQGIGGTVAQARFKPRSAWTDRFQTPSARALETDLPEPHLAVVRAVRSGFQGLDDVVESIEWTGIPMRWSFVYRLKGQNRALAYLVPDPSKPTLVLPLTYDDIEAILKRTSPKFIREGIVHATEVDRVRWAQWPLTSLSQVKELTRLAPCKHAAMIA
jgi:hypothetical protein